jgi:hypothetical protein
LSAASTERTAATFRSPILMPLCGTRLANMLAPPMILARIRPCTAPSSRISLITNGTAVCGNFAGFERSRDIDSLGSSTCAIPPTPAIASCSTMATHEPRPIVAIVPLAETA